jgi:hypothetical protein
MDPKVQAINWAPPLDGQDATAAVGGNSGLDFRLSGGIVL